jgi:superfamily II DNA/RNA helicase
MKPEKGSQTFLSITRSKAKMYEYDVPKQHHIKIDIDPSKLFDLTIGMLGDLTAQINSESPNQELLNELTVDLQFSARFFDAYTQAHLRQDLDPYLILLGSAAYYLCGLPGSSRILANRIEDDHLDLECLGLERYLLWLLKLNLSTYSNGTGQDYKEFVDNLSNSLIQFYRNNENRKQLLENAVNLRRKAYDIGTPRQLLLSDIICAVLKKRLENSTWSSIPSYSGIPVEQWADVLRKESFVKELWPAQHLLGEKGIYRGRSAVVQMPTSAGKTRATEIVIRSSFLAGRTSLVVIVAPFRALCHEIKNSLVAAFRGEPINIDELSDVFQTDFDIQELLGQKQILVVTPEKLVYVLRHNPEIAQHIGLLIYDEGHQFVSGTRGITYELLLTSLKSMVPRGIQTLLISAVISNAESIGKWLNGDDFELVVGNNLTPTYRTIGFTSWTDELGRIEFVEQEEPDRQEFFVPRVISQQKLNLLPRERTEKVFPIRDDGQSIALFLGLKLAPKGAIAIFCGRKTSAESLCEKVVKAYARGLNLTPPVEFSNHSEVKRLVYLYERNLGADSTATSCARLGIFSHHGNTPHGIRLAVEHAMKYRKARFVICTSTLAQGVNLPIRYLIVTSVYQGIKPISVRDFHNLIGRAGRADEHTEGSILFADNDLYDKKTGSRQGRWRWKRIKSLLNPGNSEPCSSSLLTIFDPISANDGYPPVQIVLADMVSAYVNDTLGEFIQEFVTSHKGFSTEDVKDQTQRKVNIMSAIENYLLSYTHETEQALEDAEVTQLAMGTLAYYLADKDQKNELVRIFLELFHNMEDRVSEPEKRRIFGKTLYGVQTSVSIERWIKEHIENLLTSQDVNGLLTAIWPVIAENISNNTFRKCDPPETLLDLAQEWIHGKAYNELLTIMLDSNVHILDGTERRKLKLESIVDICENGFAYDGSLVVAAITEIIGLVRPQDSETVITKLLELQKRLKYGLPSPQCIAIYELGFADRMISIDLSEILGNVLTDKKSLIRSAKRNEQKVRNILDRYPSFFMERLENLL